MGKICFRKNTFTLPRPHDFSINFQRQSGHALNVLVKSTFDIAVVTIKVNGEDLSNDSNPPYQWDAKNNPIFNNMTPGTYELRTTAIDKIGNKAEKTIKIMVK